VRAEYQERYLRQGCRPRPTVQPTLEWSAQVPQPGSRASKPYTVPGGLSVGHDAVRRSWCGENTYILSGLSHVMIV
jgi:hypothetical protein